MASLVMKGKARNSVIKARTMRELNCSTHFNERNVELPGEDCRLEKQREDRRRKKKLTVGRRPGSWTFQNKRGKYSVFKASAIGILFQCNSRF